MKRLIYPLAEQRSGPTRAEVAAAITRWERAHGPVPLVRRVGDRGLQATAREPTTARQRRVDRQGLYVTARPRFSYDELEVEEIE